MTARNAAVAPPGGAVAQLVASKISEEEKAKSRTEEKAAKAANRAEEKAAADAAKAEADAAKEKAAADKAAAEAALGQAAASLVASGAKGEALADAAAAALDSPSAAKVLAAAVLAALPDPTSSAWCAHGEFGAALKRLCKGKGSTQKQAAVLYAVQAAYHKIGFPKIVEEEAAPAKKDPKAAKEEKKKDSFLQRLFFELYNAEVIEEGAFNEWRYADDDDKSAPGKTDALFQLSEFLKWIDEPPEEDEDEEEEDAPAPVILKSRS